MALFSGTANPDTVTGTILDDTLLALGSDDLLFGYDGNDLLDGDIGDDFLYGGSGNDTMIGGAGEDFFYGQSGADQVSFASSAGGFTLNLFDTTGSTLDAHGDFYFSVESFLLGSFNDVLIGTATAQQVNGGAGDDLLQGFGGNDLLEGGDDNDTLDGGAGADTLNGGDGFDRVSYASATAAMTLDMAHLELATGDAAGDVYTAIEAVTLTAFDDVLLLGGAVMQGDGGAGNDDLTDTSGDNTLTGGLGNDLLRDKGGDDVMEGGAGNDVFLSGSGADNLFGGADFDEVRFLRATRLDLNNPANNTSDALGDVYDSIESFVFTTGTARYTGGSAAVTVIGAGANLSAFAGAGAENFLRTTSASMTLSYAATATAVRLTESGGALTGGLGALGDRIDGVTSLTLTGLSDTLTMTDFLSQPLGTLIAGGGSDKLTLMLNSAALIDGGKGGDQIIGTMTMGGTVIGGGGTDTINLSGGTTLSSASIVANGGDGNDVITLNSYSGFVTVTGDAGADTINVGLASLAFVEGGSGVDQIALTAVGGTASGGTEDDTITFNYRVTGAGNAELLGGAGNDTLIFAPFIPDSTFGGNSGVLNGGAGNDSLSNTSSSFMSLLVQTTYAFDAAWGDDSISGFNDGTDLLRFQSTGATQFSDLTVSGGVDFTDISFGADSIRIDGLNVADFSAADVIFI